MKSLVVGYGSIGQRHARLLAELGHDVAVVSRRPIDHSAAFGSVAEAVEAWDPEYIVVASRTSEHVESFREIADAGFDGTVLMEKPLFQRLVTLPSHGFANAFVAFNLRFHPAIRRLRELLVHRKIIAVHAYAGQYLPDWRPGTDYRESYSANIELGGGVLRDLCHELDFLTWICGPWRRLTAVGGHLSHLEISSDDVYAVTLETERCPVVTVNLNYLDDTIHRGVLALTDQGSVRVDLVAGTITAGGETETFSVQRDDTYLAQHNAVLDDAGDVCTLEEGLDVVGMIDAAETAARDRAWIGRPHAPKNTHLP